MSPVPKCTWLAALGLCLATAGAAFAQATPPVEDDDPRAAEDREPPRNYFNFRVGGSSGNHNGRPELCVEGAPLSVWSIEACGTGAGILHDQPEAEIAHFRTKFRLLDLPVPTFHLQAFAGAGFAELQVGQDDPGFSFSGASDAKTSSAGGELMLSLRALTELSRGVDFVGELSFSTAWIPHAQDLITPQNEWQPALSLSFGLGY